MADQIQLSINGTATFGTTFRETIQPGSLTIPLGAIGVAAGIQSIGTSAENIAMGDVATADQGWCYMRNQDTVNSVNWGLNDSGTLKAIGQMLPGEVAIFRLMPSAQLMLQANVAACNVEFKIFKD